MKRKILLVLLSLAFAVSSLLTVFVFIASAEESEGSIGAVGEHTNVLDDLRTDSNFDEFNYPVINDSKTEGFGTVKVIQIAESVNNQLYIYTYQPTTIAALKFNVKQMVMWDAYNETAFNHEVVESELNSEYEFYDLELVSSSDTLYKYLVKGYTVKSETYYRYYNISELFRDFNPNIDGSSSGVGQETVEKYIDVSQQWVAYWSEGRLCYEMETFESALITDKYSDFINIPNTKDGVVDMSAPFFDSLAFFDANKLGVSLQYVAFSVDNYVVEHIYDGSVSFYISKVEHNKNAGEDNDEIIVTEQNAQNKLVVRENTAYNLSCRGFGSTREVTCECIMTSEEFLSIWGDDVTSEVKSEVRSKQFVFTFLKLPWSHYILYNGSEEMGNAVDVEVYYKASRVTVFQLDFLDDRGIRYDIGCLMDKVTPDNNPGANLGDNDFDWEEVVRRIMIILGIVAIFVLLSFAMPILGPICSAIINFLVLGIKTIIKIILLPFSIVASLFSSDKRKR